MTITLTDRYEGAMMGLAVGDALGVLAEFHRRGEFEPVTDFRDCDSQGLPAGDCGKRNRSLMK